MVRSRSATVAWIRSVARPGPSKPARACSDSPAANSRWMTWSCRSAAIRWRSWSIAVRCCSARASASSIATAAWLANPAAMSTSSAANPGRPRTRAAVSTPCWRCEPCSGSTSTGPTSRLSVVIGASPGSSWARATRSGSPVVNTRPASDPATGTVRPHSPAAAGPTATSHPQVLSGGSHHGDQVRLRDLPGAFGDQLQRAVVPARPGRLGGQQPLRDRRRGLQPLPPGGPPDTAGPGRSPPRRSRPAPG